MERVPVTATIIAILMAGSAIPALSQTSGSHTAASVNNNALEEIVVTARKRDENLQSVPISITAVTASQLQANNVHRMDSFAPSIPNFKFSTQPAATDAYYIRGIGSAENFGFETAVGLVIDGFFYGKTRLGRAAFLDLDRVEVLKGPQGAILGKNNSAGAINLTTAKPTDDWTARLNTTYNFEGDVGLGVEGAVSGPLSENLLIRVAGRYDADRGFIKNLTFGNEQRRRDGTGRVTLEWKPTDALLVRGSYQRVDFKERGNPREIFVCGPGKAAQLSAPGYPTSDCVVNRRKATDGDIGDGPVQDFYRTKVDMAHFTVQAEFGDITLTSLTGYMAYESIDRFDGDNTPTADSVVITPEDYKQFIQESRVAAKLGSWDLSMGLFTMWAKHRSAFNFVLPSGGINLRAAGTQTTTTIAPFAELTYRLTPEFDITVGGRYTYERKKLNQAFDILVPITDELIAPVYDINPSRGERNFSPTLDLRWRPNSDIMVYASARRGFRGGGFDRFNFSNTQADALATIEFGAEKVTAYEIGTKLSLLDGSMRLNLAAFRSKYDDLQVSSFISAQQFRIDNAASAVTKGIEAGLDWKPTPQLVISSNIGILDATYSSFPGAACYTGQTAAQGCVGGAQDLSGKTLPFASKFSGSLNGTYTLDLSDMMKLKLFAEVTHASGYYMNPDLHPAKLQRGYEYYNARITLAASDDRWDISLIGRNLSNRTVRTATSNSAPDGIDAYVAPPRTFGIAATINY
jgi:iron complex outermembrane receptor protein